MPVRLMFVLVAAASCGGPDRGAGRGGGGGDGSPAGCVAGQSIGCVCATGGSGAQTCAAGGAGYLPCECESDEAGPSDGEGGGDGGEGEGEGEGGDPDPCRIDADGDGYFAIRPGCPGNKDCADDDPAIPGPIEIPDNGKDDDCIGGDKVTPSDCTRTVDKDGDGYYDSALRGTAQEPNGCRGVDCDDTDRNVNPGRTEIANNGKDDDCDPETPDNVPGCTDNDGDGWGSRGANDCPDRTPAEREDFDCDDQDSARNPGAPEICDGKDNDCDGVTDECEGARQRCGRERRLCLGSLDAACQQNRECDVAAGFACHLGRCKIFGEDAEDRCFDDSDCVTETCDVRSGRCRLFCEAADCGSHRVCDEEVERSCDDSLGCFDCSSSGPGQGCDCGLCAGYQCFDGPYFVTLQPAEDHPAEEDPLLQLIRVLLDCFANAAMDAPVLCAGFDTRELDRALRPEQVDDLVCGDGDGLQGDDLQQAIDMVGCGLFNLDDLVFLRPLAPGQVYVDCAWWDGADVVVGDCQGFPAER